MRCATIVAAALAAASLAIPHARAEEDTELQEILAAEARERLDAEVEHLREEVAELRSRPSPLGVLNPRITVFPDFIGTWTPRGSLSETDDTPGVVGQIDANGDGTPETNVYGPTPSQTFLDNRFGLREMEFDIRAAVDPYANAVGIFSFEAAQPGAYEAGVEEGYVTLHALPWNLQAQVGRYRLGFGQVNRTHTHDLPWTMRPRCTNEFLGEDGIVTDGVHLSWLAPRFPVTISADAINGNVDGLLAGPAFRDFAYLGRIECFQPLGATGALTLGANDLRGKNDAAGRQDTELQGLDVFYKWKPSEYRSLALLAEYYQIDRETGPASAERPSGWFAMAQFQPLQRWYFGLRYDWSDDYEARNGSEAVTMAATVSYYTTEFLRFRVGVERTLPDRPGLEDIDAIYVQLTAVFGSHPAEPFWVNR